MAIRIKTAGLVSLYVYIILSDMIFYIPSLYMYIDRIFKQPRKMKFGLTWYCKECPRPGPGTTDPTPSASLGTSQSSEWTCGPGKVGIPMGATVDVKCRRAFFWGVGHRVPSMRCCIVLFWSWDLCLSFDKRCARQPMYPPTELHSSTPPQEPMFQEPPKQEYQRRTQNTTEIG